MSSDSFSNAKIRLRFGINKGVDRNDSPEQWFDHAKLACDGLRGDYTRTLSYYDRELHDKQVYHERLINDIDSSIKQHDFVVYYQPKYGIQGERPVLRSAEALIRWKHPELGMISPGDFIPLFEGNGLVQKLDRYVWEEAGAQIARWKKEFGMTIPVSVNVSRIDIYDPELENYLLGILERNGLTTKEMLLEITESAYSDKAARLIEVVNSLREKGFRIEMDDFGSGYSSLNMLTTIPIVTLKNCEHSNIDSNYINFQDLRILVVDDEEVAAEHAKLVLDEAGIRSDIALSGQEAISMLEIAHTKQEHYNLVLLDWKMPEMDGLEVAKEIRKRYDNETTVIILTSFNWDEIMDEALHAGVDSFLSKPLFASNVIDEFERIARKNNMSLFKEKQRADLKDKRILLTANAFDEDVQRSLQVGMNAHLSKPVEPERLYQSLEELIWEAEENGGVREG